jgi:hypothetical protein
MVKKGLIFTIFLLLAVSSFAQDLQNRYLYIEGSASRMDHHDFFKSNFAMEANGTGYIVTTSRNDALHTLKFNVTSSGDPDFEQYTLSISLSRNQDDAQLVSFDFLFSSLEEMYMFTRTLFLNATSSIPLPIMTEEGTQWDKWLYLRASFDYPVTFYVLQPTGLKGGIGLENTETHQVNPLDHKIRAMPGATLGVEYQRFNFLSLELNFQLSMGDTRNNYYVNTAAGLDLKFPIKFRNVMLVPYGEFLYTFHISPVFSEFPPFAAGGGAQFCVRAGKHGALFVDAKYMFSFGDAVMHNFYELTPEPAVIHYKRSQLGIGIGYKIGIMDRPKKTAAKRMTFL